MELYQKMANEASILEQLEAANVANVPKVCDKCVRDKVTIALKLSPIGIPLDVFVQEILTSNDQLLELIRVMGPSIVRTLRSVHANNIVHYYISRSNILIVPPEAVRQAYLQFLPMRELSDALSNIDISSQCEFFVNDWGNATTLTTENVNRDLSMLVDTIFTIKYANDLTLTSRVARDKTPSYKAAQCRDYDALIAIFEHVGLPQQRPVRPQKKASQSKKKVSQPKKANKSKKASIIRTR
jgi:hypothetical protein